MNWTYQTLEPQAKTHLVSILFQSVEGSDTATIRAVLDALNPPTTTPFTDSSPKMPSLSGFSLRIVCAAIIYAKQRNNQTAAQRMVNILNTQIGVQGAN
jgi:hypothetical protein